MKVASACIALFSTVSALSTTTGSGRKTNNVQLQAVSSNDIEKASMGRRQAASAMLFGMTGLAFGAANANAAARAEYLSEPTDEFKESEKQRSEFRAAQMLIKKKFTTVLDRLTETSKTESELQGDLVELRDLVARTGGMPLGIKKDDLVKIVRRKKAQGFWPTPVEIAYQDLIREIMYQQSPNKEKDPLSSM